MSFVYAIHSCFLMHAIHGQNNSDNGVSTTANEFGMCALNVLKDLECSSGTAVSINTVSEVLSIMGTKSNRTLAIEIGACQVRCKAIQCIMSVVWGKLVGPQCTQSIMSDCTPFDTLGTTACQRVQAAALENYGNGLAPYVQGFKNPCGYCTSTANELLSESIVTETAPNPDMPVLHDDSPGGAAHAEAQDGALGASLVFSGLVLIIQVAFYM